MDPQRSAQNMRVRMKNQNMAMFGRNIFLQILTLSWAIEAADLYNTMMVFYDHPMSVPLLNVASQMMTLKDRAINFPL